MILNTVKMRFSYSSWLDSAYHLMMTLLLVMIAVLASATLSTNDLKDNSKDDVNSVVKDLQNGKRIIFAVGLVNSKMTLFISGPAGKADVSSGVTVVVDESKDGVFKLANPPGNMPSGVSSADVIFVCADSPGSKLVMMTSSSVAVVKLPEGGKEKTQITSDTALKECFREGIIHLPTSKALTYWTVSSSGEVYKNHFVGDNITSADTCNPDGHPSKLCTTDTTITVKADCQGTAPSITSGYVGASTGYFFGSDNSVYVFQASVFTSGSSSQLTKVSSKDAWKSSANVPPSSNKPGPKVETTEGTDNSITIIYVVLGILVLLLIFCCIIVYCCFFRAGSGGGKNNSKKKETGAVSGKNKDNKSKLSSMKKKSTMSPKKKQSSKGSKGKSSKAVVRSSSRRNSPKKSAAGSLSGR